MWQRSTMDDLEEAITRDAGTCERLGELSRGLWLASTAAAAARSTARGSGYSRLASLFSLPLPPPNTLLSTLRTVLSEDLLLHPNTPQHYGCPHCLKESQLRHYLVENGVYADILEQLTPYIIAASLPAAHTNEDEDELPQLDEDVLGVLKELENPNQDQTEELRRQNVVNVRKHPQDEVPQLDEDVLGVLKELENHQQDCVGELRRQNDLTVRKQLQVPMFQQQNGVVLSFPEGKWLGTLEQYLKEVEGRRDGRGMVRLRGVPPRRVSLARRPAVIPVQPLPQMELKSQTVLSRFQTTINAQKVIVEVIETDPKLQLNKNRSVLKRKLQ